jgi:hypothetical protein
MPKPGQDEIITRKHIRTFIQWGGPAPDHPIHFAGKDAQYVEVDNIDHPVRGGIKPIRVHDPDTLGTYRNIGLTQDAPDFPTTKIHFHHKHGGLSLVDLDLTCPFNVYQPTGVCRSLADFSGGWSDEVGILSYATATKRTISGNAAYDSDDPHNTEVDVTLGDYYSIGPMGFGFVGGNEVEREVIDLCVTSSVQCGDCGVSDDGTQRIYVLCKSSGAGSPGTPAELIFTTTGWKGFTYQVNITGLGATTDPIAMDVAGRYLIIVSAADNGYYYAEINALTGVPGLFTFVSSGFVASKQPQDIYVASPREVYFVGAGGYIYKSTDITTGVTVIDAGSTTTNTLRRITGADEAIVAVGDSGTVLKSVNRAATFTTVTTQPTSATVRAIAVLDEYRYWIGTSGGLLYYTTDGGESWVLKTISTFSVIDDIVATTNEVIWLAARTATPTAKLYTTWNGGADWVTSGGGNRIINFPTFNYINRIAIPPTTIAGIAANTVWAGGLAGGAVDGALVQGTANRL